MINFGYLFALAVIFLAGCDKFEGDQTVPSYLKIDSLDFFTEPDMQGTSNQKIVDAWVYVDDDLVGGFEMPAIIPVLVEGNHKLEIRPGIVLNGISDTRAPNPVFQPIIYEDFNFFPDSVVAVSGTSSYLSNARFCVDGGF